MLFPVTTKALPLLSAFTVSIVAQDAKTTVFPFSGNGSVLESPSREESALRPDMTRSSELLARPPTLPVPANNYLLAPQRTFIRHRSENVLPYVYDNPHFSYPVAHSIDYPLGPSSKQLVIVSFIGLLLLFAIIQNTIVNAKRRDILTDVLSARKKRELYAAYNFDSVTPEQEDVLDEDARVRCIQRTVCLENRKLSKVFGATGKILAKYLTYCILILMRRSPVTPMAFNVLKMLLTFLSWQGIPRLWIFREEEEVDSDCSCAFSRSVERSLKSSSGWFRLVRDAGEAGVRGEECEVLYRGCDEEVSSGS